MHSRKFLRITGYGLLLFWVVYTAINISTGNSSAIFWFCNLTVPLLAIACFERSAFLFYFVISFGILFQTPWLLDWSLYLFFDFSLFNIATFYAGAPTYFMVLTFIRHAFTVPLAIILLLFFVKPKKLNWRALLLGSGIISFIWIVSFLLGVERNINCSHYFCAPQVHSWLPFGITYAVGGLFFVSALTLLVAHFVVYLGHKYFYHRSARFKRYSSYH